VNSELVIWKIKWGKAHFRVGTGSYRIEGKSDFQRQMLGIQVTNNRNSIEEIRMNGNEATIKE
jgi:hypothetical protein